MIIINENSMFPISLFASIRNEMKGKELDFSISMEKNKKDDPNTIIELKHNNFFDNNILDLSDKDITLMCITSKNLLFSILTYLLMMKYVKFTKYMFLTDCDDYNMFNILRHLNVEIIKINPIDFNGYNYFRLFGVQPYVDTKYVFFIEHDGFVFDVNEWRNEYLNYDYIGAVWRIETRDNPDFDNKAFVGNSGFCIMSKHFLDVIYKYKQELLPYYKKYIMCDSVFCRSKYCNKIFENENVTKAPPTLARHFSFEALNTFNENLKTFFGVHLTGQKLEAHRYIFLKTYDFIKIK